MCQLIVKEARCLTRAVESPAKETGNHVRAHLFASLRNQFAKGTSRAKAVKITKSLFNKRQAVGRIYDYIDDAARAALYEFVEAEDVLEEEIEQLGKIAQTYQAETGKALTKTQLDDLIGDSNLGTKRVEEVVMVYRKDNKNPSKISLKILVSLNMVHMNYQSNLVKCQEKVLKDFEKKG